METILTGWLIKSPPDRSISRSFKFFKKQWRKRFFVLCQSQAASTLPGQCPAILYYYDDSKQSKKKGTIDLNNCEEVLADLDSHEYKHVFSLRTKHRGHDRIYYLSATSDSDMNRWVQSLCTVLHLDDSSSPVDRPNNPVINPSQLRPSTSSDKEHRYVPTPSNFKSPQTNLPMDSRSMLTKEDTSEAYIHLDECFSGSAEKQQRTPSTGSDVPPPLSPKMSPIVVPSSSDFNYCNLGDGMSQPKSGTPKYQHPKSWVNKHKSNYKSPQVWINERFGKETSGGESENGAVGFLVQSSSVLGNPSVTYGVKTSSIHNSCSSSSKSDCGSSGHGFEDYDFPTSSAVVQSNGQSIVHNYVNASPQLVRPVINVDYLDKPPRSPPENDCHGGEPRLTERTRSFRRSDCVNYSSDVQLPIKKSGFSDNSSSSDEDENSPEDPDESPIPLPPKKRSLEKAFPEPLPYKSDAVQYLDLDLEDTSTFETDKMSMVTMTSAVETDYNEIDWFKTKALSETRKLLENERRNSDKSVDERT